MRRFYSAKRNFEDLNDDSDLDPASRPTARIIPRAEHSISRSAISPNALRVLYRLREAGYEAFLVGGCVRDLLIGITPKDFDIATSALPEEVKRTFRNCRLIGRRFRLAHVFFGREIIEVATFRAMSAPERRRNPEPTAAGSRRRRSTTDARRRSRRRRDRRGR